MILNFFETFVPILVLTLIFIAHSTYEYDTDELCEQTDNFRSVFMLSGDTFFVIKNKIWKMKESESENMLAPRAEGQLIRVRDAEKLFKNNSMDIQKPMFAFGYQFMYRTNSCALVQQTGQLSECQLHRPGGEATFVCAYAFRIKDRNITSGKIPRQRHYVFSYDEGKLTEISDQELKQLVINFCYFQLEFIQELSDVTKKHPNHTDYACKPEITTGWSHMSVSPNNSYVKLYYQCLRTNNQPDFLVSIKFSLNSITEIEDQIEYYNQTREGYMRLKSMENGLFIPIGFKGGYFIFECMHTFCHIWDKLFVLDKYTYTHNVSDHWNRKKLVEFLHTLKPPFSLGFLLKCKTAQKRDQSDEPEYDPDLGPDNICGQLENIDSTFTLMGDTFFKIDGQIWKVMDTVFREPLDISEYMWKKSSRYLPMEELLKNEGIDLYLPIFAFDYQFHYNMTCELNLDNFTYMDDECEEYAPEGLPVFVCFYAFKKSNYSSYSHHSWAFTYRGFNDFSKINNAKLNVEVAKFCQHQLNFMEYTCRSVIMTGWSDMPQSSSKKVLQLYYKCFETETKKTSLMSHNMSLKSIEDINMQLEYFNLSTKQTLLDATHITLFFKFEFVRSFFIFECHQTRCLLGDPLFLTYIKFNDTNEEDRETKRILMSGLTNYTDTRTTLGKVLRCPNYLSDQIKSQISYDFCKQIYFDSIFNLGTDIYFQNEGRFWRYDSIWDKSEAKATHHELFMNVRLDSHLSSLLDKYFDISQRIVGFSIDMCLDNDCTNFTQKMIRRGIACIFGKDKVDVGNRHMFKTFVVTSAGLKELLNESAHNVSKFCRETDLFFKVDGQDTNHLSAYIALIYSSFHQYKYQVFINYIKPDSKEVTAVTWQWVINSQTLDFEEINAKTLSTNYTPAFDGAFLYKEEWFFFQCNRNDWKIYIESIKYKYHSPERPRSGYSPKFLEVKNLIYDYFNCKNNSHDNRMTHSLVAIQDPYEWICNPKDSPLREMFSVFNIGEYVYFQVGQRFYRYLDEFQEDYKPGFVYDKQVSDILNDIFDTTEIVFGYSLYERYSKEQAANKKMYFYNVVLIGSPRLHLAEKFTKKFIYNWFVKIKHPLAPLIPSFAIMKRPGVNPIDTVENYCKHEQPWKPCIPFVTRENLKALGFLHQFHDLKLYEETNKIRTGLFLWVSIDNNLYFSPNGTFMYRNPLQTDSDLYPYIMTEELKEVYGVFQMKTRNEFRTQLNILGQLPKSGETQVPRVFMISTVNKNAAPDNPFTIYKPSRYHTSMDNFFICQIEKRPSIESNAISDKPFNSYIMLIVFIEMIVVLIALIIIVVLLAVNRNRIR